MEKRETYLSNIIIDNLRKKIQDADVQVSTQVI